MESGRRRLWWPDVEAMSDRLETVGLAAWARKEGLFGQTHHGGKAGYPCEAAAEA